MKNKEFNEDKFFTELFDSKEIHKVWQKNKLYKDYVGSTYNKIKIFKDKYYENDEINSGFINSIKRFWKREVKKEHILPILGIGFLCGASGAAIGMAMVGAPVTAALTLSALVVNGAIATALVLPVTFLLNRGIEKINQFFNKEHNYMQDVKNFAENKLKNELKDYSIDELRNISYLKQFKLNEINDLKELNKKINEINKDLQDGFKNKNGKSQNYFLIKNTISVLKEKLNNPTLQDGFKNKYGESKNYFSIKNTISALKEKLQEVSNLNPFNKISTDKQILNSQLLNSNLNSQLLNLNNNDKSISQSRGLFDEQEFNRFMEDKRFEELERKVIFNQERKRSEEIFNRFMENKRFEDLVRKAELKKKATISQNKPTPF